MNRQFNDVVHRLGGPLFPALKLGLCSLASLLLAVQSAVAQDEAEPLDAEIAAPESRRLLYIDQPVRFEPGIDPILPPPIIAPDPEDDPQFVRRMDDIREYEAAVQEIESEGGAWHPGLIEQFAALGRLQQQQGDHGLAVESFDRALHLSRIDSGLHTVAQLPVVEQMIDSHVALGDWQQVDLYNNYLFFVHRRAFGSNDPRIIPALDRLAKWHMHAFNIGYGDALGVRLSSAQMLYSAAARLVNAHFGPDDERYVGFLRHLANTAYLVSRHPEYLYEVNRPEYRDSQSILRDSLRETAPIQPQGFRAGEQALIRVVNHYRRELEVQEQEGDTGNLANLAEAITHLGDWYLLFDRRRQAWQRYQEAWLLLSGSESDEEPMQRLFGQVVSIPAFTTLPVNLDIDSSNGTDRGTLEFDYADVILDVNVNGSVRNLRLMEQAADAGNVRLNRLRRQIRMSRFRPLIVDGQAVRSNDNHLRYRYWF